jgi:hypothetical protein
MSYAGHTERCSLLVLPTRLPYALRLPAWSHADAGQLPVVAPPAFAMHDA